MGPQAELEVFGRLGGTFVTKTAFDAVVASRVAWDRDYAAYFAARQALATELVDQRGKD